MSENKNLLEKHRKNAIQIASQMLSGELGIIAGSRSIQEPLDALGLRMKSEYTIFIAVDDDTDHLPIGEKARSLWHKDALPQKDVEIKELEDFYRKDVFKACRTLVDHLSANDVKE